MAHEHADRETDWPPSDRARKKPRLDSDDEHGSRSFSPRDAAHSPDRSRPSQPAGTGNSFPVAPPESRHSREYDRQRDAPRDDFAPPEPPPVSPPHPVSAPPTNVVPAPPSPGDGFRLLLANLSYNSTESQIVDFFRDAGADVDRAHLVKVTRDNRFNGNAYLYLKNQRSVEIALEQNGIEFLGRKLRVSDAQTDQLTACVRGLPSRALAADVEDLFRDCKIVDVRSRPVKGAPDLNTWFVDFADEDSFNRALAKDRSQPGLMICIATAQSVSRSGAPRTPRDAGPHPTRSDGLRDDRRDDWRDDRRLEDRDRSRDPRDRPPLIDSRDSLDRRLPPEDPQDDRRDRLPMPPGNGGPPLHPRSRSPARPYDRDYDRDRNRDRRPYDRTSDRRFPDERGSRFDRRSPRDDRYRDESDRRDFRDRDRRDHRRDSMGSRYDGEWDREPRRGDRDYGVWPRVRDHRESRSSGRLPPGGRFGPVRDDYGRYGDRSASDRPLEKEVTAVLTNLPFCEDHNRVESHLLDTLENLGERLRVTDIFPVGRRCGACVVVFRDEESLNRALALQSITINQRKVNILPLEIPSIARVQKLQPGFIADEIMNDIRRTYRVETLFVRMKQADQLLLGVEDTRYLVRLLDIDGRPLCHTRYATVSYIAHRSHGEGGGGFRSRRDEYDGGRGQGPSSARDRDDAGPDNGSGRWRNDGDDGARDGVDEGSKRGDDSGSHGYQNQEAGWKVRLTTIGKDELSVDGVWDALVKIGLRSEFAVEREDKHNIVVLGLEGDANELESVSALGKVIADGVVDLPDLKAHVISKGATYSPKKGPPDSGDIRADKDVEPEKEGQKAMDWDSARDNDKTSKSLLVSPLTPSPAHYVPLVLEKKYTNLDWEMPKTSQRLERLRSKIISGGRKEEDDENYSTFCSRLEDFCSPQQVKYSVLERPEPKLKVVWRGTVSKGSSVDCVGFLVKREHMDEKLAKGILAQTPSDLNIEFRAHVEHESLRHLLTPHSVVMVVKSMTKNRQGTPESEKVNLRNAGTMAGIVQSLKAKQKVGIARFDDPQSGRKCISLCMPPSTMVMERLKIPWKFRDFVGHNSLLVVSGPKDLET